MKKGLLERIEHAVRRIRISIHNAKMDMAWKAVEKPLHVGMTRILLSGAWVDRDNNLYNVAGKCVGKIIWNEGHGA